MVPECEIVGTEKVPPGGNRRPLSMVAGTLLGDNFLSEDE